MLPASRPSSIAAASSSPQSRSHPHPRLFPLPFLLLLLILILAGVGCVADRHARTTAVDLTQAVLKYEAEVGAKAAAEKTFYRDQLATLREVLGGNNAVTDPGTNPSQPVVVDPEKSLPYLKMTNSTNRESRIAADKLLTASTPPSMAVLVDYLQSGINNERADYLAYLERQRELTTTLGENLQPIEQQKAKAADARAALGELAKPRSKFKQTQEYAKFAKEVYDLAKPKKP